MLKRLAGLLFEGLSLNHKIWMRSTAMYIGTRLKHDGMINLHGAL